ncbi:MAG: response regulator [Proteobacteria bacterium]|nr:response regulator [Pseudomonadota bacterium]
MVASAENKQVNILIVEDSRTQAEQLRFILEKNDFKVSVATNGKEAMKLLSNLTPDVVITDIVMPEVDGYELCKKIRNDGRLKEVPVVLVTTLSDPTDVIQGLEVGANNFITKPYDESYLVSRIQYLIANTALRKNSKAEMGINVFFSGQNYFITAERLQILDLLLSTYENAFYQNRQLLNVQKELTDLNTKLEDMVLERTAELSTANDQLKIELAERQRVEEEKIKLQAQFHQAQKMESVGRLAGGVAHDYNNMLSVILGYTQIALQQIDPNSALHRDLQEVLSAANRSIGITRQLLAFARKQTIAPQILDLNETVAGMINMLRKLIGEDITLGWHPASDLCPVKIDPSQLDQILANLCVNARDAIIGVGEISIETGMVSFEPEYYLGHTKVVPGDYVFLAVNDTGCGIEKSIIDKIFEPFFTTKQVGHGTGLGLSTIYGIVEQNKGFVNVYSEPGKGTNFKIYLPCFRGGVSQAKEENNAVCHNGRGKTVLIVEDELAILRLTSRIMSDLGYTVLTANSPTEAINLAEKQVGGIHLLLSDVIMPEMNGPDMVVRILARHSNLKYLFMSGYTDNVIANQVSLNVSSHFIQKPFSAKQLAAKVQETMDSLDFSS